MNRQTVFQWAAMFVCKTKIGKTLSDIMYMCVFLMNISTVNLKKKRNSFLQTEIVLVLVSRPTVLQWAAMFEWQRGALSDSGRLTGHFISLFTVARQTHVADM